MEAWKLRDLRDGKDYLYIVELDGNVLTRSYGWENGKLRKSARSYDNEAKAKTEADKAVTKKKNEGYTLMEEPANDESIETPAPLHGDTPEDRDTTDPDPDDTDAGTDLFPIMGVMRVRSAKIKHPVLLCAMPNGYRFKVYTSLPYDRTVIRCKAQLSYVKVDTLGIPVDPTLMGVIDG